MSFQVLKSGWMLRQSSILKRWKRSWFALYADGNFAYFEDESRNDRHGNFCVRANCKGIQTALECAVEPPEGHNFGCLLKLVARDGDHLVVAAMNSDEALAWKVALEQMIVKQVPLPVPQQPTTTTVYTTGYPCRRRYGRYPYATTVTTTHYPAPQVNANYPVQQNVPPPGQTQSNGYPVQQPMYYNPTYGTPVQVCYNSYGQPYYVNPQSQVVTVIRDDDPYYYRRGDMFLGVAAGAMLGAALWSPFLFF
uniref:Pleckstrin homology domain-containing family B member 2 n=1 Tax=Phallusia mammillata TaxID=59560 RepID=A0A6F9DP23_9ASCI|nr:pleckstrin homology domain-containing family B member 2 [Phallusia mammillata]